MMIANIEQSCVHPAGILGASYQRASLIAQSVKNLPTIQEPRVRFLGWEDQPRGKIPWRRKWQPTPVSLPGKSHGQRSLAGYSPWGRKSRTRLSN